MLKSLFGDLGIGAPTRTEARKDFTPTAILETQEHVTRADGRLVERRHQDLIVDGSPAQAMREHLARTSRQESVRVITLFDPSLLWAPAVVRALSDATGQVVQRLHIRDQQTQQLMVTLERTVIPRRGDTTLKLYRADVPVVDGDRSPGDDSDLTPYVLMESSDMAAVIIGTMTPVQLDGVLECLTAAVHAVTWRCPTLVFMLPPGAHWARQRIQDVTWPPGLAVELIDEPLTAASSVWNTLLGAWDRHETPVLPAAALERDEGAEEARAVARQLRLLMSTAGFVGCAVADVQTGLLVAGESHEAGVDLAHTAAAIAPTLRAQQHAAQTMGLLVPVEEVIVCAGSDQHVVRPLLSKPNLFLFARLNRAYANLTLARLKIAEAQRALDTAE